MSFLDAMNRDGRDLLVALPYRVGVWMSHIDKTGGESASQEEAKALENIMGGFTQDVFGSEIVQIVMTETLQRKEDWTGPWGENLSNVPQECEKAQAMLKDAGIEEKEVSAYKQRLIEIAEAVALAFREYEELGFFQKMQMYILYYKHRSKAVKDGLSYMELEQFLSISPAEHKALFKLSNILGLS